MRSLGIELCELLCRNTDIRGPVSVLREHPTGGFSYADPLALSGPWEGEALSPDTMFRAKSGRNCFVCRLLNEITSTS